MTVLLPWPGMRAVASPQARAPAPRALTGSVLLDLSVPLKDPVGPRRHFLNLRAGMAELVLLNRLRARTRQELSQDILERAARIIEVTASSWLGEGGALVDAASALDAAAPGPQDASGAGGRAAA